MKMLRELYNYRQMIISLVQRDLRGRYKGSALGFLWTFINPLFQLLIYTIVFSTIMRAGIDKFYMFLFVALIPWMFFSACLQQGATSVLDNKEMVTKIYFPRIVLPLSYVISSFVNMLFSFIIVFAVIIITGFGVNWTALLFLPVIMLIEFLLALGISLLTSACTVFVRDLQHILSIIAMGWMYLTPIVYPETIVPAQYVKLFYLNPMTSVVVAYRDILYYKRIPQMNTLMMAAGMGLLLVVVGVLVFNRLQRSFAEEL